MAILSLKIKHLVICQNLHMQPKKEQYVLLSIFEVLMFDELTHLKVLGKLLPILLKLLIVYSVVTLI